VVDEKLDGRMGMVYDERRSSLLRTIDGSSSDCLAVSGCLTTTAEKEHDVEQAALSENLLA